jgi:putative addiction module killer protein
MNLVVLEYVRENGANPFKKWFDDLPLDAAAKISSARARLEMGNISSLKWIGTIGEYRIDWGPGYRIYLGKDGTDIVILLGGGTKQRQRADIEQAKEFWSEYKARKARLARSAKGN